MEFKHAVSVCLISICSATLVVLVARSLDLQAASRVEPHLVRIAEQLEALRASGGLVATSGSNPGASALTEGLMVYYFHSNTRCPTCRSIESQAYDVVLSHYAEQFESGRLMWKTVNYEESAGRELTEKFAVQMPVVVLARMQNGEIAAWQRLDSVWSLVNKPEEFAEYVRGEVDQLLSATAADPASISSGAAADTPRPQDHSDIPLPE